MTWPKLKARELFLQLVEREQRETAFFEKDVAEIQGHWSLDAGFNCEDEQERPLSELLLSKILKIWRETGHNLKMKNQAQSVQPYLGHTSLLNIRLGT